MLEIRIEKDDFSCGPSRMFRVSTSKNGTSWSSSVAMYLDELKLLRDKIEEFLLNPIEIKESSSE